MARLPQPGGDDGSWGDILNDFLRQAHNADGSLKPVTKRQLAEGAVGVKQLAQDVTHVSVRRITGQHRLSVEDMSVGVLEVDAASPVTITIPAGLAVGAGAIVEICQVGAGQVTLAAESGVTLHSSASLKLRTRWSSATLRCRQPNEWVLGGDLV